MRMTIPTRCGLSKLERILIPLAFVAIVTSVAMEIKQINANAFTDPYSKCFDVEALSGFDDDGNVVSMTQTICLFGEPVVRTEKDGRVEFSKVGKRFT